MTTEPYTYRVAFWEKDEPRVMGDLIGRPEAIELLGDVTGKRILDSGVGTGYVARILARKGAKVYGCDNKDAMLEIAKESERKHPLGIEYALADIAEIPYDADFFDGIISTGVLINNDTEKIRQFLEESRRILRPGGSLVISVAHPSLFMPSSPSRSGGVCWVEHIPIDNLPYDSSQRFKEFYYDKDGKVFKSDVWHHTEETYLNMALESSLDLARVQNVMVREEHLIIPRWGESHDYPAFFQMELTK